MSKLSQLLSRGRQCIVVGALLACLFVATPARGAYDYSITPSFTTANIGGTTITLVPGSRTGLTGTNYVSFGDLTLSSNSSTPDTINLPYTLTVLINNPSGPGTPGTFSITGELSGMVSSTSSTLSNTYTSVTPPLETIGGAVFTVSVGTPGVPDLFYSPPTVNGQQGALGGIISGQTLVPEPGIVALLAPALVSLMLRRRAVR